MMGLIIRDGIGKMLTVEMRRLFEQAVNETELLKHNYPLGVNETEGRFDCYQNANTDNLWCGFALGLRCAERIKKASMSNAQDQRRAEIPRRPENQ